ncbi:MAG TPA: BrnT family toxin [Steroidobacteraceae bacterium]|nr:BrnT family toxin [Steroidobacteraceae bacterium]
MSSTGPSAIGAAHQPPTERAARQRQRLRLIDACISALHIHGPSRTTVEKVVALADLSPGIVRFYFDSKDAMLVASLVHLGEEFEQRVLVPVAQLKETPERALELLVELYLDADIASTRKVSAWYSFWGEASSRQEYYEICGRQDDAFGALVRDLIERMIVAAGATHLDAEGIALGLIGVLEVLWQGFAFQSESEIDRPAARRGAMGYLRSVFPGHFGAAEPATRRAKQGVSPAQAAAALADPCAVEWLDERHSTGGQRTLLLGRADHQVLTVLYAERSGRPRIVFARRATAYEAQVYRDENALGAD